MRAAYAARAQHVDLLNKGHSVVASRLVDCAERFEHEVQTALQHGTDVDDALQTTAALIFPPCQQPRQRWIRHHTWQLIQERALAWHHFRTARALAALRPLAAQGVLHLWASWTKWHRLQRTVKKGLAVDKREDLNSMADSASKAAARGDQRTLYQMVRSLMPRPLRPSAGLRTKEGTLTSSAAEELQEWDSYLAETFQATHDTPEVAPLPEAEGTLVTTSDVLSALRKRRLGKATPTGTPTTEMVRLAENVLATHLTPLWNSIAQKGTMPMSWRTTQLVWIPKPGGNPHDPKAMRGIHLLHPVGASYCTAIQRKLARAWNHLWHPTEHGALPNRSTRDPLLLVNSLILRARKLKKSFGCYFGDLRKAFDLINRTKVCQSLEALIPPGPLRRATLDRHQLLCTQIRCEDRVSTYTLPHGVAQGDSLGPICFVGTYQSFCQTLD